MNSELRKTLHYKAMLRNKYFNKGRTKSAWYAYRRIRNKSNKIRAKSIQTYFNKKCSSDKNTNQNQFWKTIKPFISDSGNNTTGSITLRENETLVSDPKNMCEIFNSYFCNVAKDIGPEDSLNYSDTIQNIISYFQNHVKYKAVICRFT